MATKSTSVLVRLEPQVKEDAEAVFDQMGLSMSTAINIFLKQVIRTNKIPFEISAVMPPKAVEDMSPDELSVGLGTDEGRQGGAFRGSDGHRQKKAGPMSLNSRHELLPHMSGVQDQVSRLNEDAESP